MTITRAVVAYRRRVVQRRLAGRRAKARYVHLRHVWLRKRRRVFVLIGAILVLVAAAGSAYDRWWTGRFGFISGMCWGVAGMAWFALRHSPPGFVDNWQQGAWGEEFTANELAQLPHPEWEAVHDLRDGNGNVDHVLFGPAGVFLLDSKKYAGTLRVDGDEIVVTNELDPSVAYRDRSMLRAVRGQAARLNAELRARSGRSAWVEALVVVWGDFPERIHVGDRVTVIHGRELVGWLKTRPQRGATASELAEHLRPGRHRRPARVTGG